MFAGMLRPYSKTLDKAVMSQSMTNTLAYFGFFIRDDFFVRLTPGVATSNPAGNISK
jgi:hypothetical protein